MALRLLKFISTKWVYGQHFSWALVEAIKTKPWLWGGSVYWVHNYLKHSWIQSRVMACFVSWKSLWALSKPWNICKIKFKSLIHKPSQLKLLWNHKNTDGGLLRVPWRCPWGWRGSVSWWVWAGTSGRPPRTSRWWPESWCLRSASPLLQSPEASGWSCCRRFAWSGTPVIHIETIIER